MRQHFSIQGGDNPPSILTATVVQRDSEARISTDVLVQTEDGARFRFIWLEDFTKQTSSRELREVGGSEFVRYTMFLPYTARTFSATRAEAHAHPELMNDKHAHFELVATGNSAITGTVDLWKDPGTAQQWRSRARLMLSPTFIDEMEKLETAGAFADPTLLDLDSLLIGRLLYRTDCRTASSLVKTPLPPDCGFDKKFGFECSDKQKERAEKYGAQTPPATKSY